MIITGLNRFFSRHGRVTFFLIAVVISVSFVLFMTGQSVFDLFLRRDMGPEALTVLGRKVTLNDRTEAVDRILIQQAIVYPAANLLNPDYQKLDAYGINHLMLCFAAEDHGIVISDDEVRKHIVTLPTFQTEGKFDNAKLNEFVESKLKPRHLTKRDLDEAVRSQLAIEKLTGNITESVIVPPEEIREAFMNINEKARVSIAAFDASDYVSQVQVTEDEARAFYESNKSRYLKPPALKFLCVSYDYGLFRKEAWEKTSVDELRNFYEANKHLYVKKASEDSDSGGKADDADPKKVEHEPFDDVADKVRNRIADEKSRVLAAEAAGNFSDKIYDKIRDVFDVIKDPEDARERCREIFDTEARAAGKDVFTSGWLYEGETFIKGIGEEPMLARALASLFLDDPVTEPVRGANSVFVAMISEQKLQEPQSFEDQKDKIYSDLEKSRALTLAVEAAREAAVKIGTALDEGADLQDVAAELGIEFKPLGQELRAAANYPGIPHGEVIHRLAFSTRQGQLSPAQNLPDGALIVYVAEKSFPNEEEFKTQEAFFSMRYKMSKQQSVWQDFTRNLGIGK
ncbi:MAG: SurA N-terminal domain-containing protein [Victivallales bacterium]|nr:SurA N-terminal domain-containing protein [Victivallales bacterium]